VLTLLTKSFILAAVFLMPSYSFATFLIDSRPLSWLCPSAAPLVAPHNNATESQVPTTEAVDQRKVPVPGPRLRWAFVHREAGAVAHGHGRRSGLRHIYAGWRFKDIRHLHRLICGPNLWGFCSLRCIQVHCKCSGAAAHNATVLRSGLYQDKV